MAMYEFEIQPGEVVDGEGRDVEEAFRDALEVNQKFTSYVLHALLRTGNDKQ